LPNISTPKEIKQLLGPLLTAKRRKRIAQILKERTRYVTLVLDDLYHQHNMSAVVRSCEAFGFQDLHVIEIENKFMPNQGVAMGAQQWVTIFRHNSVSECISSLRQTGYRIFAADPPEKAVATKEKAAITIYDLDLKSGPVAIVLGKELDGLDDIIRSQCHGVVYIPLKGFTESLNVSVTAALFLYHLRQKLKDISKEKWRLPSNYKEELEALWYIHSLKRGRQILEKLIKRKDQIKQLRQKGAS